VAVWASTAGRRSPRVSARASATQVAVDEAGVVRGGQPAAGLHERGEDLGVGAGRALHPGGEVGAADQLHRDEHVIALDADVVHADDVGVGEPRHRHALAPQAIGAGAIEVTAARAQHLDRDLAIELGITAANTMPMPPAPTRLVSW
jgi:hypothetical protein